MEEDSQFKIREARSREVTTDPVQMREMTPSSFTHTNSILQFDVDDRDSLLS